ncbi:MAG: FG-GAP repeat domain-containing protein [Planctomycetota bacterium]|jgi:hypothetical protein
MFRHVAVCLGLCLGGFSSTGAAAPDPPLAEFFGFEGLEVIKIGRHAGPLAPADMNGDGRTDLIAVNNHASRIEIHYQRPQARPGELAPRTDRVNELPEHWRYRRQLISVTHRVQAVVPHDFDDDGMTDLIYAGSPPELVMLRQASPGVFEVSQRHQVRHLATNRNGLAVVDVLGDAQPELLALVRGRIHIWPMAGDRLGQPVELAANEEMLAFTLADFNGDGRLDVAGIIPEDAAPVRLWLGAAEGGRQTLGGQLRFELPALREFETVRLPGERAQMAVIERQSKRIALHQLVSEPIERTGHREATTLVYSFSDRGRRRDQTVIDVDGDRLPDLVATDAEASAVVVFRQAAGKGLQAGESYPSLSDLKQIAAGDVDDDPFAELFVLSEEEGVVGRSDVGPDGVPFPNPLPISDGHTPVALNLVALDGEPTLAVVTKSGRNYVLELLDMAGQRQTIELESVSRSPETIVAIDADQNGRSDLLLFTPDKPMTMIYAGADGFEVTESDDMGQFGLVKAATAENTAVFDIDGDGREELLLADRNFVRALRFDTDPPLGISPGWQVVTQINAQDSASRLISLALLGDRIVAADEANGRLIVMARDAGVSPAGSWRETESIDVRQLAFNSIYTGSFSGNEQESLLAVGDDGFAVIRFTGQRPALRELAAWRTDEDRRLQHELASGDVNGDGFSDLVSLDAGEQMCEIFTLAESGKLLYAAGFQVFESKIFSGGESREYQPSEVHIADVTGDGANDLILLAHDRVIIYPQMTGPGLGSRAKAEVTR